MPPPTRLTVRPHAPEPWGCSWRGTPSIFGTLVRKPTLGDPVRPVEPEDISRACRLMYATEGLTLLLFVGIGLILNLL